MGEFSLSGNTNIGLSAVDISVNTSKNNNTNSIFYTTPTSTSATDTVLQAQQGRPAMQDDELVDKTVVSSSNGDEVGGSGSTITDKSSKECDSSTSTSNDLSDKLNEQVVHTAKTVSSLPPLFHSNEPSNPTGGALWSNAIEDTYMPNMANVNGSLGFQNYSNQQQLFGNNSNQNQGGRRAITASHNFPHNMGRQQSGHPLYKGYGSWANPGQSWSGSSSGWNRGRSVPNLTPLQQMGVANRKPSPTFNHQQVISPVKFRRSTSYPGKGPFPQPPTFEITNMDETRELLPYQVISGTFEYCTVTLVIATLPIAPTLAVLCCRLLLLLAVSLIIKIFSLVTFLCDNFVLNKSLIMFVRIYLFNFIY